MLCIPTSSICLTDVDQELRLLHDRLQSALTKLSLAKQLLKASTQIPSPEEKYDYTPQHVCPMVTIRSCVMSSGWTGPVFGCELH